MTMLEKSLNKSRKALEQTVSSFKKEMEAEDIGRVIAITGPVAKAEGLENVRSEELVQFSDGTVGIVASLDPGRWALSCWANLTTFWRAAN